MNRLFTKFLIVLFTIINYCNADSAIAQSFNFALFSDLHIQISNPEASGDLENAVESVNNTAGIDFIIVSGDITETGDLLSLKEAKTLLDKLKKPYYIIAGNHETKWSESGYTDFSKVFGDDKFSFTHNGIKFIGFTTGPVIKMGDGHISPQDIAWVKKELSEIPEDMPVIAVTHYPLLAGDVDNWYEMTDILRKYNVQLVLGGHYHKNSAVNYDGLSGILNRSTLKTKGDSGGFNIYSISDTIRIYTKLNDREPEIWMSVPMEHKEYNDPDQTLRPDFSINQYAKNIKVKWQYDIGAAIFTTAAVNSHSVYFGDDNGEFHCLRSKNGKQKWSYKTGSRIISSPAISERHVVFGSTDGFINCLDAENGKLIWKNETSAAVMGCPLISNDTVFIGGSDGKFSALNLNNGKTMWIYDDIKGYIETKPVIAGGKIMFGAWDSNFYALNQHNGSLAWIWNNGNSRIHFSPAAVHPVVSGEKVFITAPDRYFTALDVSTGKEIWRTKEHQVRETIGISADKSKVYSRYMTDYVIAMDANADDPQLLWKSNAGFGYDHNPSMLIENNGTIIFGTKNGLLCGINSENGDVLWKYKTGNSIINTITPFAKNEFIMTTTGGIIARVKY
ncbi:MAG: PQQ-binding-like beta-propeller repeat protein [Saprospiraceae bacterium]|nr:PQQ-binding-like beta-propeller repeat protein [Saprospiraceae bacterium]